MSLISQTPIQLVNGGSNRYENGKRDYNYNYCRSETIRTKKKTSKNCLEFWDAVADHHYRDTLQKPD